MADQFVGEIRMFAGNFAPVGWAFCNGQLLPISQNTALFSLLGTNYGGDGKSTFGLPNLQGSFAMHAGASPGPGLSIHSVGEIGGEAAHALTAAELPGHTHKLEAAGSASTGTPSNSVAPGVTAGPKVYAPLTNPVAMAGSAISGAGGSAPHENRHPYLALSFIIALQGIFPARS
jgi:microcystin-dependent protein